MINDLLTAMVAAVNASDCVETPCVPGPADDDCFSNMPLIVAEWAEDLDQARNFAGGPIQPRETITWTIYVGHCGSLPAAAKVAQDIWLTRTVGGAVEGLKAILWAPSTLGGRRQPVVIAGDGTRWLVRQVDARPLKPPRAARWTYALQGRTTFETCEKFAIEC